MDAEKEKLENKNDDDNKNDDEKNTSTDKGKAENDAVTIPPSNNEAKGEEKPAEEAEAAEKGDAAAVESEAKEGGGEDSADTNLIQECPPPSALNLDKLSQEVDDYLATLSAPKEDEAIPQDVPNFVKQFSLMVEARVADYDSGDSPVKWGSLSPEDSTSFLEAITRLSSLSIGLSDFSSQPNFARSINRIGGVLERAISYVEEEFKNLLEDYRFQDSDPNNSAAAATAAAEEPKPEEGSEENPPPPEPAPKEENYFPGYEEEVHADLVRLSKMMIAIGYETECCEAYFLARRNALEDSLHKLGFEKHSIDDVQKMQWEFLEREIVSWISIFKQCTSLFKSEQKLSKAVFPDHPSVSDELLCSLAQGVSATLLTFASAVALTKSSSEKLFKFLDTYEVLRDVLPTMNDIFPDEWVRDFKAETTTIKGRLGEAIVSIFSELQNSIKADAGKTPVPGGAIHPLTRYTMNYLKYACEYKETLEMIFRDHQKTDGGGGADSATASDVEHAKGNTASASPFAAQMMKIMDLLDENLEAKSKLYKDHALGAIFLMNNGRYILQKVRGSNEINSLMGDAWFRKKSTDLRQYHKVYQRETWGKLLSYLHPDGLTSHGKVVKPVLKERFKNFNAMFDEIHRTQTTWVVCDEQLQSELRVSISNMVVPAYRSFLGRYNQIFTPGRQTEKYVKYQGEDIENSIEELFDGKK